jgi:hypothetical protein
VSLNKNYFISLIQVEIEQKIELNNEHSQYTKLFEHSIKIALKTDLKENLTDSLEDNMKKRKEKIIKAE